MSTKQARGTRHDAKLAALRAQFTAEEQAIIKERARRAAEALQAEIDAAGGLDAWVVANRW